MDVRIFELPIYGVAEKQFRGKWDAHRNCPKLRRN